MKKIMMTTVVGAFTLVGSLAFFAKDADAIPVFARKYGLSCNSCHTMFPKLSKMGVAFRERGFRFAEGKEDLDMQGGPGKNVDTGAESPAAVFASNFPFTVRSQILFSGAGPITDAAGQPVMPGHRFGMLDQATRFTKGVQNGLQAGEWSTNNKVGFGELGLISSGSYDNAFWWMDANQNGIGMLEGGYYVNDLFKVRVGRVQNDVGYGMTMMSRRPLGFGAVDAAQMAGGTMLMMGEGISIHGTTNGDSGVGTLYNFSAFTYGKNGTTDALGNAINAKVAGKRGSAYYGRVAQEIMDNHIIGVYGYKAKNWVSDTMGGDAAMYMAMGTLDPVTGLASANSMQFTDVTRYGMDFAINYGEPMQLYGAFTFGSNTSAATGQKLDVRGFTVASEWLVKDGIMLGAKWDYSRAELQANALTSVTPKATQNFTVYGLYQVAQNVQGFLTYTNSKNLVTSMGMNMMAGSTIVRQQSTLNTIIAGIDLAL
ncbi:hypothetical protein [Mariprofundus ferrooxydans]|uniref:Probable cytochrome c1 protein n=1 Tax=Mariprofundus ferrooxydans PV-1 TaxID=314345 RepID=Q0F1M8_9PROT|nr:hypothetical protein [Mariprofundus ferrooxydans]EAU55163.1 probable cytochrome c1 precursor protein [Mariprofundus ferrooxydans PV-1]